MLFLHLYSVEIKEQFVPKEDYDALERKYENLAWELRELKRMIFGQKSEKHTFIPPGQANLFDIPVDEKPVAKEQISYEREKPTAEKKKPVRTPLPAHLPRVEEIIEPDNIPANAKYIGDEVTEILEYEPPKIYVRRITRRKYGLQGDGILTAPMPSMAIPFSNAGASLLAYLIVAKFVDHLPFYRIVKMFARSDLTLAESTLSGWFSKACKLLEPLYEQMKEHLLSESYLMADESPIKVLDQQKKRSTHRGYHWVYYTPESGLVVFDYQKGRGQDGPENFLKDYHGILQTDGYGVYDSFTKVRPHITHAGCMAHVRRKFFEAKDQDKERAEYVLQRIAELYKIEAELRAVQASPEYISSKRADAREVFNTWKQWLDRESVKVLPQSPIGKAMTYALNQWPKLQVYLDHPKMHIDNNLIENSIRPLAIGRKNYLFAGSHDAAQNAAMIYSFMGTCKLHGVEPFAWLKHVLQNINGTKKSELSKLFPGNYSKGVTG